MATTPQVHLSVYLAAVDVATMASTQNLQALLRFLSQDAKVPLATAMSKVKDLQAAKMIT